MQQWQREDELAACGYNTYHQLESGQPAFKKQTFLILSPNPLWAFKAEQYFTLLRLPFNEVFNATMDQPWVRPQSQSTTTPHSPEQKSIIPSMKARGTKSSTIEVSDGTWKNLSSKLPQKVRIYTRSSHQCRTTKRSASYSTTTYAITQYKAIEWPDSSNKDRGVPPLITPPVFQFNSMYF